MLPPVTQAQAARPLLAGQDPSPLARLELHPPRLVSFRAACAHLKSLAGSPAPQQGPGTGPGHYHAISQLLRPAQHGLEAEVERLQAQASPGLVAPA